MIEEALAYASQGFHVFPILPGQKRPLTQHGFKEATTDPETIRGWWTETPDANIGWYPHPSGHCVVDLDLDHADLDLPPTRVNETPSGGEHHIFIGELPPTQSKLGAHIDTRGLDSYVLLPPSVVGGNAYKVKHDHPLAYVPWEFGERLTKVKPDPRNTEKRKDEIDTPERILWMRDLARAADPATEGEGSNDATVELANRLLDWCSHDEVYDAMWGLWAPRCQGEWTGDWLSDKVYSIEQGCGRDSAIGCAEFEQPAYTPNESTTHKPNRRSKVALKNGATSKIQEITWIWQNWLAEGKFHILAGSGGAGKSTITFDLMARISTGGKWPDGTQAPLGAVLVWSGEDNFEDTILPRFVAAGGDRNRLYCVSGFGDGEDSRPFDPSTDMDELLEAARGIEGLKLVLIDPIVNAIKSGQDSHNNAETRRGLQPVVDFAEACNVAVLGITHYTKGTEGRDPTERVTGSLAFAALARVVLGASADEDGEQRRMVITKSNIGPTGGGFAYRLARGTADNLSAQTIVWGEVLKGSARELLQGTKMKPGNLAKEFILSFLAGGPKPSAVIEDAAHANGITRSTLHRAKEALGITPKQNVGALISGWYWELPVAE